MTKKYSLETKLAAAQYYLNGSDSIRVLLINLIYLKQCYIVG